MSSLGESWADEPLSLPYETVLDGGPGGRGWIALGTGLSEGNSGRLRMSVGPVSRGNGVGCGGCAGCWIILRKAFLHELSERPYAGVRDAIEFPRQLAVSYLEAGGYAPSLD